jgi:hypothetical protein
MIVTLDSKRRLTVPATLAPTSPGEYFDAQFDAEEDAIVFRRLAGKEDWLAVLKKCPVSMDDVPPRRREMARRRKLWVGSSIRTSSDSLPNAAVARALSRGSNPRKTSATRAQS